MMDSSGRLSGVIASAVSHVVKRPLLTVVVVIGLTVASLNFAAQNLGINTDTANMISPELPWRQDFIAYRDSFPARDRNLVGVIDAPDAETSEAFARELAAALEREPELFPTVFLAGAGEFFDRNGLLYLSIDELEQLYDRLVDAQPFLGRLGDDASAAGILRILGSSVEQRQNLGPGPAAELDSTFRELALTIDASRRGERRPVGWGGLIGAARNTSTRQLLLVQPTLEFDRVRPAAAAIERLIEVGDEINERFGGRVDLRLTGTLAMEHEELTSITRSASAAGLAALVSVVLVLFWALRSFVLLIIAVIVLLSGLALTAAFAALTVGHLNLLSVAFAVLYIGLGVDFILHMSLRLKELRAQGTELDAALVHTARGVGSSLLICAITTAAGFFAFVPTDFDGVSELGLISGGGMFISLVVSLSLLPALIKLLWRGGAVAATARAAAPRFRGLKLPPGQTLIAAGAAVVAALLVLPGLRFDGNPINLRDPDAESIRALADLAADSEAPIFDLAVIVPDDAAAAAAADALGSLPTVERVVTAASLVPGDQTDKLFVLEDLGLVLGSTLSGIQAAEPDPARLIVELEALAEVLARDPSAGEVRQSMRVAIEQWLDYLSTLATDQAEALASTLEHDLVGNLFDRVARLERGLGAEAFGRDDLPDALRSRWINESGAELVEIVPREDLNDAEAAARFVADVRSVAPTATGLPVVYEEAAQTVTRAFTFALAYAFIIVSVLLMIFLRSIRDTVLVLVPIVFAALMTAALSVLLGLPLNFANIIALPLLVGVGVDSGIHMVHRMRTEPPSDGNVIHTSTSRAVLMSALTTVASFGNLAFSTHLGMASMGQLLTLGMAMSIVAILGLLPALMRFVRVT
jgi:hopanoid biosynthesis associated RND transporter like protein HpnN